MKTYEELRQIALKENVPDNKVYIGIWIRLNGYKKIKRTIVNNKFVWLYDKTQITE